MKRRRKRAQKAVSRAGECKGAVIHEDQAFAVMRKTEEDNGKERADLERDWHRLFRGKPSEENNEDNSEDSDNNENEYDDDE
ncbi:hypothetical protein Y1Q_0011080 [Alligator mississippiensis]|uniref:Uncharacterized protein n=1 Tax=Alligator mississippiensis TaxID=8496 RepID=A0A151NWU7_ALLMI|nr:hypothetical protein Y1Q_0011080 [Alligator mississippiensis]